MRVPVYAADLAALCFRVDVVRIRSVLEHPETVAAVHVLPTRVTDATGVGRIAHPRTVVLQSSVHVVWVRVVRTHVVKLRNRKVHLVFPAVSAIFAAPQ